MSSLPQILLFGTTILLKSVLGLPVQSIPIPQTETNDVYSTKYYNLIKPSDQSHQIIFGQPQTHMTDAEGSHIEQSRIRFPESQPATERLVFEKLQGSHSHQQASLRQRQAPLKASADEVISTIGSNRRFYASPIKYEKDEPRRQRYYWLLQWLNEKITMSDDGNLVLRLDEAENLIEKEVLRSGYLSLFQTPLRKKKCPNGKRRDYSGRCVTVLDLRYLSY